MCVTVHSLLLPQGLKPGKFSTRSQSKYANMSQQAPDTRINELEIHIAHLESAMHDMSDMIKSQWDRIDLLERRNKLMAEDIKRLVDFLRTSPEDDAPPPHY